MEPIKNGLALKIFDAYPDVPLLKDMKWGDDRKEGEPKKNVHLIDATIFQNYCWYHGIAPRVYGLKQVKRKGKQYWAQITDYIEGEVGVGSLYEQAKKLGEVYGFQVAKDDYNDNDAIGGKLVDFNTFHPAEGREELVRKLYVEQGRYGKIYYHNALGLKNSPRDNEQRIKWMGLDRIKFKGKSVLDIGCAGGYFLHYAKDQGATCLGIDNEQTIHAAFIWANEMRYWDISFMAMDATQELPKGKFDIVLYLSMNFHIGFPDTLWDVLNKDSTLVVEDNAKDREEIKLPEKIGHRFERLEFVGRSKDHGNKPSYHCYGFKK